MAGSAVNLPANTGDSGSVDLQLGNLEDIKKQPSSLELTGEMGER